jgi:2-oxo-4-hydroxy-4-carboxy-5-ureidoimidazoline decarboxylase
MSSQAVMEFVNSLDHDRFVSTFGSVFEHFPHAARAAHARGPFASAEQLHGAMMSVIRALDAPAQRAFLNLHPQLSGANIRAGTMTADSNAEQKSAGLDALSREQETALDTLNEAYAKQHGFPFIVCVRHYTREGIFSAFERRLHRSTQEELDEALAQIAAITRGRLNARLLHIEREAAGTTPAQAS